MRFFEQRREAKKLIWCGYYIIWVWDFFRLIPMWIDCKKCDKKKQQQGGLPEIASADLPVIELPDET